jgi:hypothetical protein
MKLGLSCAIQAGKTDISFAPYQRHTRQPLEAVHSSRAIQAPIALGGFVYKNVESLWHGTPCQLLSLRSVCRLTCTTNLGLFADYHTLQYSGIFMSSQLLCDLPNFAVVESVLLEYRVKNPKSVADLVDRLGGRYQELGRSFCGGFAD